MSKNKNEPPKLVPSKASLEKVSKGFERAKVKSDKTKGKPNPADFVEVK